MAVGCARVTGGRCARDRRETHLSVENSGTSASRRVSLNAWDETGEASFGPVSSRQQSSNTGSEVVRWW